MKLVARIAACLLCLVLCISAVACANSNENPKTTTPADDNTTPPAHDTDSPGADTSGSDAYAPLEQDFGDATITTLYWDDVERAEFFDDDISGDNVGDAIHNRNIAVEEQLKVKLRYVGTPGNVDHSSDFLKKVETSFKAGEKEYNILASHSRTAAVVAAGGMTQNLLAIDDSYLDLDKPWWPPTMVDTATIGDGMYFISGDISTNTLHFMYGVYYNVDTVTNLGLDDPTDMALDGTWTLDKMIAMTANTYEDLNSNSTADYGDRFGLTTLYYHVDSFYSAAGMRWISKDSSGYMAVSPDYGSEKSINLADKLTAWFNTGVCYTNNNNTEVCKIFAEGNSLFTQNRIYIADNQHTCGLNNADFKYSVVPLPKYDDAQTGYFTTVGNPMTLYEVMKGSDNQDIATAVLESLAYNGYQLTSPAIFEVNMKYKYSLDNKTSQCFDLIRGNIVFDLGRIFGAKLNTMSELWSKSCINGNGWASQAKSNEKMIARMVTKLNDSFE